MVNAEYGRKRLTRVCRPVLKVSNIRTCQAGDPDDGTPQDSDPITRNVSISEDGAGGTHRDDEVGGPEEAIPCVCVGTIEEMMRAISAVWNRRKPA